MSFSLQTYLESFLNWETRLQEARPADMGLERVQRLLEVVGHPEDKLKFVHVAGSKGKGSTCIILANILRCAGYRVGLFTSPHFFSYCERIRILEPDLSGEQGARSRGNLNDSSNSSALHAPCSELFEGAITMEDLTDRMSFYSSDVEQLRQKGVAVTYFELWFAMACTYFALRKVDVVVLETGLGGRLDATNSVDTMVCGITSIGMEHASLLGPTLGDIAAEKAGIVKAPSQKVVLAPQSPQAEMVCDARCALFGNRPTKVGNDMPYQVVLQDETGVRFTTHGRRDYQDLFLPLVGEHQVVNATMAIAMAEDLEVFGFCLTQDAVRRGLANVHWPGRFERVHENPVVILDCAHTPESAQALVATFQSVYPARKVIAVVGMSKDKDVARFCQELDPIVESAVLTRADHSRAFDPAGKNSAGLFPNKKVCCTNNVLSAIAEAKHLAGRDGIILVCGSVFVVAEARSHVSV